MQNLRDVHTYDGTLTNIYSSPNTYTNEQKAQLFSDFIEELKHTSFDRRTFSIHIVAMMINDLNYRSNFDPLNNVDSSDILADILVRKNYKESLEFFQEQLADIQQLGSCVQGRSTRLLGYWSALPLK